MKDLASSLKHRAERLFPRLGRASAILMYHRVAAESYDPWDICVTPQNFAEQMDVLRARAEPVDLATIAADRRAPRSRKARVALTFDDGYRDNILAALPILERYDVPATVFVVSGAVGSTREFWWDALERCVLRPPTLPQVLEIEIGGVLRRWFLPPGRGGAVTSEWRADVDEAATPQQALFLELWNILVLLDGDERECVIDTLMDWGGIDRAVGPERLPMDADEIGRLSAHPLIRIGAHTEGHASLPHQAPEAKRREIEAGQKALEDMVDGPVDRFAFPFGRRDPVADTLVRERFALACTSRPAPVTPLADPWALPRLQAVNGGGEVFETRIRRWLPSFGA